eukprot:11218632-Lingulodinium_polyedra.AAC.1
MATGTKQQEFGQARAGAGVKMPRPPPALASPARSPAPRGPPCNAAGRPSGLVRELPASPPGIQRQRLQTL